MPSFGVHAGLQNILPSELIAAWQRIEALGFEWISVWDHLYGATGRADDTECLEAVAMHSALACSTSKVRCGALVYSIGYRHPAILAKAVTTIDHLSAGRAEFGIGAGWAQLEYDVFGFRFPPAAERLDQMEEGLRCIRGLLHDESTSFSGTYFTLTDAHNDPRPVQRRLPIWVGGQGEQRTLRSAARYADGWNGPFLSPAKFAHKRDVLHRHCDDAGRDPGEIRCAVNVGLAFSEESLRHQFGSIVEFVRPGVLTGSDDEIVDRIGQYTLAGVDQLNLALRAPLDLDALERFAALLHLS